MSFKIEAMLFLWYKAKGFRIGEQSEPGRQKESLSGDFLANIEDRRKRWATQFQAMPANHRKADVGLHG
jgi:hypothetical protein